MCREAVGDICLVWGVMRKDTDSGSYGGLEEDGGDALWRERQLKEEGKSLSVAWRTL